MGDTNPLLGSSVPLWGALSLHCGSWFLTSDSNLLQGPWPLTGGTGPLLGASTPYEGAQALNVVPHSSLTGWGRLQSLTGSLWSLPGDPQSLPGAPVTSWGPPVPYRDPSPFLGTPKGFWRGESLTEGCLGGSSPFGRGQPCPGGPKVPLSWGGGAGGAPWAGCQPLSPGPARGRGGQRRAASMGSPCRGGVGYMGAGGVRRDRVCTRMGVQHWRCTGMGAWGWGRARMGCTGMGVHVVGEAGDTGVCKERGALRIWGVQGLGCAWVCQDRGCARAWWHTGIGRLGVGCKDWGV